MKVRIIDFDIIYLSYDEPNAEKNYADLCSKVPWAKRVHGVKGSDAAHKACANLSETDRFITVDGDNVINQEFLNVEVDIPENNGNLVLSWCGKNVINGLMYGNGGLKIWKKDFVLNMRTHENSDSDRGQVDFCWEEGYKNFPRTFSDSIITASPFQAWRAGFREGVKMTLLDGVKVPPQEIQERIWWHNIHRLRMWSTVGAHEENGVYAILGARMGTWMTNCTDWNYIDVRDFDKLKDIYDEKVNHTFVEEDAQDYGVKLKHQLGFDWPFLNAKQSKYTLDLYDEAINLGLTYYQMPANV